MRAPRRIMGAIGLGGVALLLLAAPQGHAVVVEVLHGTRTGQDSVIVTGDGRDDRIGVQIEGGRLVVRSSAPISIAPGQFPGECVARSEREASCYSATGLAVRGGSGDDVLTVRGREAQVEGGSGRDRLYAEGSSTLNGGAGRDVLRGGRGGQEMSGDGPSAFDDLLDGGPGFDTSIYPRSAPIRGDLSRGIAGQRGEHDRLTSIEGLTGGAGRDVLIGTAGADFLDGRSGADVLLGRGGDDVLIGGELDRRVDAGPGDDHLVVSALFGDSDEWIIGDPGNAPVAAPRCGPGTDSVVAGHPLTVLLDCERWARDPQEPEIALPGRDGRSSVRCQDELFVACRGDVRLVVGGKEIARDRFAGLRLRRLALDLRPRGPRGARLLRTARDARIVVRFRLIGTHGLADRDGRTRVRFRIGG